MMLVAPRRIHPGFLQFLPSAIRHKVFNGRKWRDVSHSQVEETDTDAWVSRRGPSMWNFFSLDDMMDELRFEVLSKTKRSLQSVRK